MCLMQVKVYLVQVFLESSCKRKFLSTFKLFFSEHLRASNKNARIILWSFYLANLNFFHPLLPLQFTFYPWLIVWVGYRWPSKNTLSIGSLKADVAIKNPSSQVNDISTGAFRFWLGWLKFLNIIGSWNGLHFLLKFNPAKSMKRNLNPANIAMNIFY